jgi:hypothetical protein
MFVLDLGEDELEKKEDVDAEEKKEEILDELDTAPAPPLPLPFALPLPLDAGMAAAVTEGAPELGPKDSSLLECLLDSFTSVFACSNDCCDRNPKIFSAKS